MAAPNAAVILEGWLKKEGNGGVWKKRYAVLSARKLELFKDETKTALLGNIHVRDAELKLEEPEEENEKEEIVNNSSTGTGGPSSSKDSGHSTSGSGEKLFVFTINTSKSKLYTLAATTKEDAEKWMNALSIQAVQQSHRTKSPLTAAPTAASAPTSATPDLSGESSLARQLSHINLSSSDPFKEVSQTMGNGMTTAVQPEVARSPPPPEPQVNPVSITVKGPPTVTNISIQLEKGVLKVQRTYDGDKEGASTIEWLRSDDGGREFTSIPSTSGLEYKPTADDLECDLRVKYTPMDHMGDRGLTAYSENFKLKLEPSFFNHLKNIFLQGYAVFTVREPEEGGSNIVLLLNRKKLKVRRGKTIAKSNFNVEMQVRLDVHDPKLFQIDLSSKKKHQFTFVAPSAVGRDGIALTIRLFNALGCKEIAKHILGERGRTTWMGAQSPNDAVSALRDRVTDPIPADAPKGVLVMRKAAEKLLVACESN